MESFSVAQGVQARNGDQSYVEVTGSAQLEAIPDEIYISISLSESSDVQTMNEEEANLKQAIRNSKVDLKDLTIALNSDAESLKIYKSETEVVVKRSYLLKVSTTAAAGRVFQELDKIFIRNAFVSKIGHSKIDSLKKEVRVIAVRAAKKKADYLLSGLGEQTGKVLMIKDTPEEAEDPTQSSSSNNSDDLIQNSNNEVRLKKIQLTSNITARFSVK